MASSELIAIRRGRDSAFGSVISLIAIVFGSTLAMRLPRKSTYHGTPFESMRIPYGYVGAPGLFDGAAEIFISPVAGMRRPTWPDCSVNHSLPFWSKNGVCGPRASGSAFCTGNSVVAPVLGSD